MPINLPAILFIINYFLYNNKVHRLSLAFYKRNVWKIGILWAHWHAKLKNWHTVWHGGTPYWNIGTPCDTLGGLFARLNVEMIGWHVPGTLAHKQFVTGANPHWHVNNAGLQACLHVDHVGIQPHMARNLANFFSPINKQ